MPINADKPHLWKADVARSVSFFNRGLPRAIRKQLPDRSKERRVASKKAATLEAKQYSTSRLSRHGFKQVSADECRNLDTMPVGSFTYCQPLSSGKKAVLEVFPPTAL